MIATCALDDAPPRGTLAILALSLFVGIDTSLLNGMRGPVGGGV